ncbi:MAG TPA: aminotransferase class IV [Vicinamibacteria bacterium]
MASFASVNGVITPAEEARVSILDNGFTFGDAVYETLRTYAGRPFALGRHFARLRLSASRLGCAVPQGDDALAATLDALLERAGHAESFIRLIVTRGVGDISYHFERVKGPTVVMAVKPFEAFPESHYAEGIPLALVGVRRNHPRALDPAIKSNNLLNNVLAVREAQSKGAQEAILLNQDGLVAEGASTNVFLVNGDVVVTPPLSAGILHGITREVVLEAAREHDIEVNESAVSPDALRAADEIFVTSSTREVMPASSLDGAPVGTGKPGPVTRRLLDAYRAAVPRYCV